MLILLEKSAIVKISRFTLSLWLLLRWILEAGAVSCYCTLCDGGVCEADLCLVGFKTTRAQIHRACGHNLEHPVSVCSTNARDWQEVCTCKDRDYCNTYNYFRTNINTAYSQHPPEKNPYANAPYQAPEPDSSSSRVNYPPSSYEGQARHATDPMGQASSGYGPYVNSNHQGVGSQPVNPYAEYEDGYADRDFRPRNGPFSNSHLIVLLVCVPLGIGTLAVGLIFVNYHCKLG